MRGVAPLRRDDTEAALAPTRHDTPLASVKRSATLAVLAVLLVWQVGVAVAGTVRELAAEPVSERLDALRLTADARRRAQLGERETLHAGLVEALAGLPGEAEPRVILWCPPARPGRLFEPDALVLTDMLRALLFPVAVRPFSASRPVPPAVESVLDERWFVVDLTGGAALPRAHAFRELATGADWTLLQFRGAP